MPTDPHHTPIIQPSTSQPQKKQSRRKQRKGTEIPQFSVPTEPVADEAIYEERDDSLERATTTTASLDTEHDRVNTLRNGEDRLKLKELMALCTNLQNRVLDLEHTKTTQALEIDSLKRRVKKLEKKQRSRTHGLTRLYRGRIDDIDADEDIYLVNVHRDEDMFGVNDLKGDEIVVKSEVADKDVNLSIDEVTLAQALAALKSAKVQEKGDVIKEPSVSVSTQEQEQAPTPIVSSQQPTQIKDKGKGKMVKEEPVKKMSKKELLKLDEKLAFKLQA
ncbi:hypothetical protein Tco_0945581, partial [Tanacetum coccineum]